MPFSLFIKIRLQKSFSKKPLVPIHICSTLRLLIILHSSPKTKTLIYNKSL